MRIVRPAGVGPWLLCSRLGLSFPRQHSSLAEPAAVACIRCRRKRNARCPDSSTVFRQNVLRSAGANGRSMFCGRAIVAMSAWTDRARTWLFVSTASRQRSPFTMLTEAHFNSINILMRNWSVYAGDSKSENISMIATVERQANVSSPFYL